MNPDSPAIQPPPTPATPVRRRPIPRFYWFGTVGMGLLGAGLVAFWLAWVCLKQKDWYYGVPLLVLGLACVGGCGGIWRWGKRMQQAALRPAPWLDRRDWAKGEIAAAENATSALGLGSIGLLASGVALFLFLFGSSIHADVELKWIALLFGTAFSAAAIYSARFRRKFGKSFLRLSTLPGVIGGTLEGTICINAAFPRNTTFEVRLQCLKLERRGSGKDGETVGTVLWQSQQVVAWAQGEAANSSILPVKFQIPNGCPESADPLGLSNHILWQLTVTATLPGIDYTAGFEVPVYAKFNAVP